MPNIWLAEDDLDAMEFYGGDESVDDTDTEDLEVEGWDDAESRRSSRRTAEARRRARRRAQLRARARRRAALARARRGRAAPTPSRSPTTAKAEVQKTKAAVRELSLESEEQADAAARGLTTQRRRI